MNVTGDAKVVPVGRTSNTGPSAPVGQDCAMSIVKCTRTLSASGGIFNVSRPSADTTVPPSGPMVSTLPGTQRLPRQS
jgi:hypothetical protein